ncbi:hypothetical protein E4U13_004579 [Claviceps humidiphila]|uniref:Secretory phospholipase A2 n=1 Tax=Claviceps humidiphila TaxID=1294629 RepID=A0A9P7PZE9_9HYPO|nr:hypothetical protein E4U13_004579 [Claviceps humidiphila]
MKHLTLLVAALAPAILAAPADENMLEERTYDDFSTTDRLLFRTPLPVFENVRFQQNPSSLIWASDGCNGGPNNPFKYPFKPACQRHDFGFENYKAQHRLTRHNRKLLDKQFLRDLYYQCDTVRARKPCYRLADVYYRFGRWFGGKKRDTNEIDAAEVAPADAPAEAEPGHVEPSFEEAMAAYEKAVSEAKTEGLLPASEA